MPSVMLTNPVPGSAAANAGGLQPYTLEPGVQIQVGTNIQAASGAPNTTPQTPAFTVQPTPGGGDRTLNVSAQGIGAIPTTVTANLLVSYDGGLTWQTFATNIALVAAGVAAVSEVLHVVGGALYAFALSTLTLGGATGVNINVSVS